MNMEEFLDRLKSIQKTYVERVRTANMAFKEETAIAHEEFFGESVPEPEQTLNDEYQVYKRSKS